MISQQSLFAGAGALIFGGAKGIGRSVALEWARRGARVAVADIDDAAARAVAQEIEAAGGEAVGLTADVLDEGSIAEAVAAAEVAWGGLGLLMNNVGAIINGHPEDVPMAEWHRIMDLNYFAAVRGVKQVLPGFLARGSGHIVNTASFAGLYPYAASRMPYAAAKAAVIALSESLALHCEPRGVRVSCLIPGPVATDVMASMTTWTEDCPMRGPGAETTLMLPDACAAVLADGMEAGRILIPSDPVAFAIVRRWADDPDAFIRTKIAEFERGDTGTPQVPADLLALLKR